MLLAKMSVVEDVRDAARRELAEETTIRLEDRPRVVGVFNLSTTGCLIRSEAPLHPGLEVRIGLPGVGAFDAEVVRSDGLDAGCRFRQALSPKEVEAAFTSDVVVDGNWTPEPGPVASGDQVSGRTGLALIIGISGVLWGLIGAGFSLLF